MQILKRSVDWCRQRHEEECLDGDWSTVTRLLAQSRRFCCRCWFFFVCLLVSLFAEFMTIHVWAAPVCWQCDWLISRWTVKIKRMTNKHAAYTALGANPTPSTTPRNPFWGPTAEESPQTVTDIGENTHTHITCSRATSVSWSSWQDPSSSEQPQQRLQHTARAHPAICPPGTTGGLRPYVFFFEATEQKRTKTFSYLPSSITRGDILREK